MLVCTLLVLPLYVVLQIVIPLITQIIQTVCNWVSSVIQTVIQTVSQVCSWLPWPLSTVCNWVTTVLTVVQTVWNWVCNTVIQTIITFITWLLGIILYVTRIICIIISIIVGLPAFVLCLLRLNPRKRMRICVKVLTDEKGQSAVTQAAIDQNIQRIITSYRECNIEALIIGVERIVKPEYLTTTGSSFGNIFSLWHLWFTLRACSCCSQVTVFVVDDIVGSLVGGVTFWGDSWCRVDSDCNTDDTVMAHEIGHVLSLWHVNDPNNVMYATTSATAHDFTSFQCCLAKRSPFVTYA
jgi:hypothetical protein